MALLSERVISWLKEWFTLNGRNTAVIGISGGKDSAVVAALCVKALGVENVVGVMMPNGARMSQEDKQDALQVIKELGIYSYSVDVEAAYSGLCTAVCTGTGEEVSSAAKINIAPRLRMTALYAIAQSLGDSHPGTHACVVGTGNKGERMVGYTTKWGDSACDVNPIQDLWVDEVLQVGDELGFFHNIIHKAPADGLCGKSDEERLGFTYDQVRAVAEGRGGVPAEISQKVGRCICNSVHKRIPIPYFKNTRGEGC